MENTLYPILKLLITVGTTVLVCRLCMKTFFWGGASRKQRLKERALANGWVTEGKLSSKDTVHRDSVQAFHEGNMSPFHDTVGVSYTYYVNGRAYTCGGQVRPNAYGYHEIHDTITVYYNANNPRECVMSEESLNQQQKKNGMLITMALTVLTLAVMPHIVDFVFGILI